MGGGEGGRADGSDRLPERHPVFRGDARCIPRQHDIGGRVGRQALDGVVVDQDADPDVVAEQLPEGVVARHDEEVGHVVGAGDNDLLGLGQLGCLGRATVNGSKPGRDAVVEAPSGLGQSHPGAGALEQARFELGDLAADGGLRGAQLVRRQGEVGVACGALEGDRRIGGRNAVGVANFHDYRTLHHKHVLLIWHHFPNADIGEFRSSLESSSNRRRLPSRAPYRKQAGL